MKKLMLVLVIAITALASCKKVDDHQTDIYFKPQKIIFSVISMKQTDGGYSGCDPVTYKAYINGELKHEGTDFGYCDTLYQDDVFEVFAIAYADTMTCRISFEINGQTKKYWDKSGNTSYFKYVYDKAL